jgi:hypothetical protein
MYTFLKPFYLNGRRFSRVVTYSKKHFFGFYKGCQIEIDHKCNHTDKWSIDVRHADGGMLYDGYFYAATIELAISEALEGARLVSPTSAERPAVTTPTGTGLC